MFPLQFTFNIMLYWVQCTSWGLLYSVSSPPPPPIFPVLLVHVLKQRHYFLRAFSWFDTLRMGSRIEFVFGYFQSIHHYHNPWKSFKMGIQ